MTLDAAHDYARRGWGVVPLYGLDDDQTCRCGRGSICPAKTRGKHPSNGKQWQDNALTSGADIQAWYDDHPNDNIGIATGRSSGLWVLDIDGAEGIRTITSLAAEHGSLPLTRIIRTGSGGLHYYWRHPADFDVRNSTSWLGPGIDVRGKGGQVVAPPSVSARGAYELIADHPVAEAPSWLTDLVREHASYSAAGANAQVKGAERVDIEFVPQAIHDLVGKIIGADQGRYRHFHAIVAAIYENGYTQGQAVTLAAPWCAAVDKFVGRVEAEVARSWAKLELEAAKANEWVDGIAGPKTSTPTPPDQIYATQPDADDDTADDDLTPPEIEPTWRPVDLEPILTGTYVPETPTLLPRSDGHNLLYPGRVHSLHGESESGKSLVAQAECARLVRGGGSVLYIDFESDAAPLVGRMLELGCTQDQIRSDFTYLRPDNDPRKFAHERGELAAVLDNDWTLIVIDGVTDALGIFGAGSTDNDEISAFMRAFPRMLARKTGAAVVLIDHVTKDADTRGRYAVGGQAKMNALDGAAYVVEVIEALGRGMRGVVTLRVAKDRPGGVRPHSGHFRKIDRTQESARIVVDSTVAPGERIDVTVEAPSHAGETKADKSKPFRRTGYMGRVSEYLELEGEPQSTNAIETGVGGNAAYTREALRTLIAEGFVLVEKGARSANMHTLITPYNPDSDPESDTYTGWLAPVDNSDSHIGFDPTSSTSSDLVSTSSKNGQATSSSPVPPLRGLDEVSGGQNEVTSSDLVQLNCNGCGNAFDEAYLSYRAGMCDDCRKNRRS